MSMLQITKDDHLQGLLSAPIVLVEYGDYQCSYCGQAYPIVKRLQKKFGDKMAFVFRNYPLQEIHPNAVNAAIAAEAAAIQNKFWQMHDILFENQRHLDDSSLMGYANRIGLNPSEFEKDFGSQKVIGKIQEDMKSGNRLGVRGTPSFFVNGEYFNGNWMTSEFEEYLQSLL